VELPKKVGSAYLILDVLETVILNKQARSCLQMLRLFVPDLIWLRRRPHEDDVPAGTVENLRLVGVDFTPRRTALCVRLRANKQESEGNQNVSSKHRVNGVE
jgi:hypothetical protein